MEYKREWFEHRGRWWTYEEGTAAGGVSVSETRGDGIPWTPPQEDMDDCDEAESGQVTAYGEQAATLRAIYAERGAVAVLEFLWQQGFDL
jgi:hypothetical protein